MGTTIYPTDRADAQRLARRLLDAAGPGRHDEVRTVSEGPLGVAFDVPDDLASEVLEAASSPGAAGGEDATPAEVDPTNRGLPTDRDAPVAAPAADVDGSTPGSAVPVAPAGKAPRRPRNR